MQFSLYFILAPFAIVTVGALPVVTSSAPMQLGELSARAPKAAGVGKGVNGILTGVGELVSGNIAGGVGTIVGSATGIAKGKGAKAAA